MLPLDLSLLLFVVLFSSTNGTANANMLGSGSGDNNAINILFLESAGGEFDISVTAVQKAVEDVNMDPEVLPDYSLELLYNENIRDTECTGNINISQAAFYDVLCNNSMELIQCDENSDLTLARFFDAFSQFPLPLAVLGLGSNSIEDAKLAAHISQYFHLNMLSFSAMCLTENIDLANHFCMLPSKKHLLYSIAGFIEHFGWQRAAIITENGYPYGLDSQQLLQRLQAGVTLIKELRIDPEISIPEMDNLLVPDIHIFVVNTSPAVATALLCEALKQEKGYPNYVWITPDWYPVQWWTKSEHITNITCLQEQLTDFITGSISLSHYPTAQGDNSDPSSLYAYDAVWTVALALNETLPFAVNMQCTDIDECGGSVKFEDLVNCFIQRGEEIKREIETLSFTGISGEVSFENGSRTLDHVNILQYRRDTNGILKRIVVAHISKLGLQLEYVDNESSSTLWPGGIPPDGTPQQVINYIRIPIVVTAYIGAVGVIIFAVVCCAFNFIFRKRKLIQLTSPYLNYLIICGTILMAINVFVHVYVPDQPQSVYKVSCLLPIWLSCLGYNLCMGTINAKMLRIYHIFHNPRPKKRVEKDWHLMLVILAFVIIDVITLTVVIALPKDRYHAVFIKDRESSSTTNERQVRVDYYILNCQSRSNAYWLSVVYGYKAVLQIVALILAIKLRKVKISGLNDSREIRRVVYIISGILLLLLINSFFLTKYLNTKKSIAALGLITGPTAGLGFIFIPKMIGLYRDPHGEKIFKTVESGTATDISLSCSLQMQHSDKEIIRK